MFHDVTPFACVLPAAMLQGHGVSNVTIEGCTFTGMYDPAQALAVQAQASADGCPYFILSGGSPVSFFGGGNITFTDNEVTDNWGGLGVFFDGSNGVTVSNNVFANNYQHGMQFSSCKNCNTTGNYSVDSDFDIEDAGAQPPGSSSGVWSNNTIACVQGPGRGVGHPLTSGNSICYLGAAGCSALTCTTGEYSGITFENNLVTGVGAAIDTPPNSGVNLLSNTYTNGGQLCTNGTTFQ
jgi:parallel beta-helix repeat protein